MSLSAEMIAVAVELIDEFGAAVTFTRGSKGGTYDPSQGKTAGASAPQTMSPKCLTEDKGRWLGPELGVVGEKKLTLAADGLAFEPAPGDKFSHRGKTYSVMPKGVVASEVEGVPVLYEVYGVSGA